MRLHPEQTRKETFLINGTIDDYNQMVKNKPAFIKSIRMGKNAYSPDFTQIIQGLKPIFAKIKRY